MKKMTALLLVATMLVTGCAPTTTSTAPAPSASAPASSTATPSSSAPEKALKPIAKADLKVGFVYIGEINDEGYTQAQDKGRLALEEMGIQTHYIENVKEDASCGDAIRSLIDQGCNVVYTTSFGFMDYTETAAKEFPNVYFGHCSGYKATENMSNYFGRVYQARYLSGIAAGMKTEKNKIGYVAAFPIPEVIRGINAFTQGVRSVNPEATVEVVWTNTWYDPALEKQAAIAVLDKGVDVLTQHQDTTAPQIAAQERGAFAIGYNSPTASAAPKAYLTAPLFHWDVFIKDDVQKIIDGTWTSRSYWEGLNVGMVSLDALTENCATGTKEAIEAAQTKIISGELNPFAGPIQDNEGKERVPAGAAMTDAEMLSVDWLVEGVIGAVPKN